MERFRVYINGVNCRLTTDTRGWYYWLLDAVCDEGMNWLPILEGADLDQAAALVGTFQEVEERDNEYWIIKQ